MGVAVLRCPIVLTNELARDTWGRCHVLSRYCRVDLAPLVTTVSFSYVENDPPTPLSSMQTCQGRFKLLKSFDVRLSSLIDFIGLAA